MTTAETIADALKQLGYSYDNRLGWTRKDAIAQNDSGKLIAYKVRNLLENKGAKYIPSVDNIIGNLELLQSQDKEIYIEKCHAAIKFNPSAKDTFDELSRLFSGENYHTIYPHILRQVVFAIKNKMLGRKVRCPIFAIFYGDPGTGKSTIICHLSSPLPQHQYIVFKNGETLVNSDKHTQMLMDNVVIHLDELSGMNKASLDKLKTIVDMWYASFVRLYENSTTSGFVKATLIGATNHQVKNILISTDDNRKWAQLNFYSRRNHDEAFCREKITKIENFDYVNLWQSINEDGIEPFGDAKVYEDYLQYLRETCRSSSPTVEFIDKMIDERGGDWMSKKELYDMYRHALKDETDSKPQRKDLFNETCESRGFSFRRSGHGGVWGYDIPKRDDKDILDIQQWREANERYEH